MMNGCWLLTTYQEVHQLTRLLLSPPLAQEISVVRIESGPNLAYILEIKTPINKKRVLEKHTCIQQTSILKLIALILHHKYNMEKMGDVSYHAVCLTSPLTLSPVLCHHPSLSSHLICPSSSYHFNPHFNIEPILSNSPPQSSCCILIIFIQLPLNDDYQPPKRGSCLHHKVVCSSFLLYNIIE